MDDNNQIPTKVVITQDKLVDLLLHAATREDIAKLASDTKTDNIELRNEFKAENATLRHQLKADNARLRDDFKADNVTLRNWAQEALLEMRRSNEALEARLDRQFIKIDQRYNWIIGIVLATGLTLAGMIAKAAHWL